MAFPTRLVLSYIFDWIVVIVVAAGGGVLNYISGFHRPFSLADISIAYPLKDNIISIPVLIVVAFIAPAGVIIFLCSIGRLFGLTSFQRSHNVWLQTAWEIHVGVLGLCASLAGTLFVTSGLKDVIGKPRPELLARCDADLSNISGFMVGGYGDAVYSESSVLVTSGICRQADKRLLDDGFAAFPSGHSSFACAGLIYLTLWLCARYSLAIPYLDYREGIAKSEKTRGGEKSAPPLWQLACALAPAVVALFICATRYADFHHAGFDIICGAILGIVFAWASFRLYHQPIRRAKGILAWRERSDHHAFFSSAAKFEEEGRAGVTLPGPAGQANTTSNDEYELRDNGGIRPVRADTANSSSPIFYPQHTGR